MKEIDTCQTRPYDDCMNKNQEESQEQETGLKEDIRDRMRRGGRRSILETLMEDVQDEYQRLLMTIELGAYDYVAAEAIGIGKSTWSQWMRYGRRDDEAGEDSIYRRFMLDVMQAQAKARMTVEMQVRRDNPEFWLTRGPGKTRPDRPGWTESIAVVGDADADPITVSNHLIQEDVVTPTDAATVLLLMEQLGIVELNSNHQSVLKYSNVVDADDDSDDDPEDPDRGYNPEKDKPLKELPRNINPLEAHEEEQG